MSFEQACHLVKYEVSGGFGARHCVAVAMFQAGKYPQAAAQFEAIARDMGQDRPGLRAELWAQAGQAWIEAGQADKTQEKRDAAERGERGASGHDRDCSSRSNFL